MKCMRFRKYPPSIAVGAAGLFAGLLYNNFPHQRQNIVPSETSFLNIGLNVGANIEAGATACSPLMKHGLPSYDRLMRYSEFILSYNMRTKNPDWVMEHLTPDKFDVKEGMTPACRRWSRFYEDESLDKLHRAHLKDYKGSGFDKGHLAPGRNYMCSQESYNETYVLTNIAPQDSNFNQKIWHDLEQHVLKLTKEFGSVYICCGPLYEPREFNSDEVEKILSLEGKDRWDKIRESTEEYKDESCKKKKNIISKKMKDGSSKEKFIMYKVIGENNVAVPTHFFKAILIEISGCYYDVESYVIPNRGGLKRTPLQMYLVPLDEIKHSSGLAIFHDIKTSDLRNINGKNRMEDKDKNEIKQSPSLDVFHETKPSDLLTMIEEDCMDHKEELEAESRTV